MAASCTCNNQTQSFPSSSYFAKDPDPNRGSQSSINPSLGYISIPDANYGSLAQLVEAYDCNQVPVNANIGINEITQFHGAHIIIAMNNIGGGVNSYNGGPYDVILCQDDYSWGHLSDIASVFSNVSPISGSTSTGYMYVVAQIIYSYPGDPAGSPGTNLFTLQTIGLYGGGAATISGTQYIAQHQGASALTCLSTSPAPFLWEFDAQGYISQLLINQNSAISIGQGYPGGGDPQSNYNCCAAYRQYPWLTGSNASSYPLRVIVTTPSPYMQTYFLYTASSQAQAFQLTCAIGVPLSTQPNNAAVCAVLNLVPGTLAANAFVNSVIKTNYTSYKNQIMSYCEGSPATGVDCDDGYKTYCSQVGVDPTIATYAECGCYMPSSYMTNYWNSLLSQIPESARTTIIQSAECNFPYCIASPVHDYTINTGKQACPNEVNCFENTTVNVEGKVTGNIVVNQDTSCSGFNGCTGNSCPPYVPPTPPAPSKAKILAIIGAAAGGLILLIIIIALIFRKK